MNFDIKTVIRRRKKEKNEDHVQEKQDDNEEMPQMKVKISNLWADAPISILQR